MNSVAKDISHILMERDIPEFFGDIFNEYEEMYPSTAEKKSLIEKYIKACKEENATSCKGSTPFNQYPSSHTGDLRHFFLGLCPWNEKMEKTFNALSEWIREHSSRKETGMKFAVVLTEQWDAKKYKEYENLLNISVNSMDLKIVFILVAEHGASEIKAI